ncbi:MAG: MAPEG family protein [Hyphomonadaceae bacterium]
MHQVHPSALTPLVAFALWAVLLAFLLAFARVGAMRAERRAVNTFRAIGDTARLDQFSRAHMNTLENLPIFAVVYLAALWTDAAAPVVALGWTVLAARAVQSLIHIGSVTVPAVQARAAMQFVQFICFVWLGAAALIAANA